jgi:hypothetical protein
MTDRPTVTPPGIDAPAIHRETNPEAQDPSPEAFLSDHLVIIRVPADQDQAQAPVSPKPKSRARLDREAASLAFWRAVVDASRAKGNL